MGTVIKGNFIELVEDEDVLPWRFTDPTTKITYASEFQLRVVPNSLKRLWEKEHTDTSYTRRGKQEDFNWGPWVDQCLDYAIVGWDGVRRRGQELPCTPENKLKLPEIIRAEIVRLCVGKELGEIMVSGPGGASEPMLGKEAETKESRGPN